MLFNQSVEFCFLLLFILRHDLIREIGIPISPRGDGRERPHRGRRAGNPTRLTFQQGWSPYHLQQVVLQRVSPGVLRERGCEMDPLEQIHRCRQGPIKDQEKERY
ncbi:hypothetical protein Bbelb_162620 [Branchiostoma belcheri]|nr:hypothetical protein Bbelb_162620 [Branchiostoma belcheri]